MQKFVEMGMAHTYCSVYGRSIVYPISVEGFYQSNENESWNKRQSEDMREEAKRIQEEQKHLRDLLEEEYGKFEEKQSGMEAQGLLHILARRSVTMEESPYSHENTRTRLLGSVLSVGSHEAKDLGKSANAETGESSPHRGL